MWETCRRSGFDPWVGKNPFRIKWQPTPVDLPGKSHEQRSLAGYSPWGLKESDMTERLNNHNPPKESHNFSFLFQFIRKSIAMGANMPFTPLWYLLISPIEPRGRLGTLEDNGIQFKLENSLVLIFFNFYACLSFVTDDSGLPLAIIIENFPLLPKGSQDCFKVDGFKENLGEKID